MAVVTGVFGAIAESYDEVRPGYPAELGPAILDYHGSVPTSVVEIGAGTGKGTQLLVGLGAPVTCIEPDAGMAAVLRTRFPDVQVHAETFERWVPPSGGVPMLACALAWHWLDPATRNQRAHAALTPGGTLAVLGHKYDHADPGHARAIHAALRVLDPTVQERAADWFHSDIIDSGLFADVRPHVVTRHVELSKEGYLKLMQTFGPFRTRSSELQRRGVEAVGAALDGLGGGTTLAVRTTLVLARRPA
ncbi:MAG TPA: class I SAM-dependent methyltransferase [Micromonosporaceae bacterium]|nr:class I SAM-dependent methyltransferase [Micromonosporaceae bacterium]